MELAHAAGDELGELAAEVEDDDRVGLAAAGAGGAGAGAVPGERSGGGALSAVSR